MERLLETYGRDGMVLYALGEEYEAVGDLEHALSFYEEAYKSFPLQQWKAFALRAAERVRHQLERTQGLEGVVSWESLAVDDDTLLVVSCTARKVWSICRDAPAKLPAILVYQGASFHRFLARVAELEKSFGKVRWVVLSAKHGFLEPCAVIGDYDTRFGDPDAISDDELRQQVLMKSIGDRSLFSFKKVYVYTSNNLYFEKVAKAFQGIAKCYRVKE